MEVVTAILVVLSAFITGAVLYGMGFKKGVQFSVESRLYFQDSFDEWVNSRVKEMEDQLSDSLRKAQDQANEMVMSAHAQANEIYKEAARGNKPKAPSHMN